MSKNVFVTSSLVPTLGVGTQALSLCGDFIQHRRAVKREYPRGAWVRAVWSWAAKAWTPAPTTEHVGVQALVASHATPASALDPIQLFASILLVAALTLALRVPSCYESFWVDELHTAWTIHDAASDVLPRSQIGHQQPYYFGMLWLWRQICGESEVAMRMTSVLAVALSGMMLVSSVARTSQSVMAGLASGIFLAVESNSIFFGTELRPYAAVMLASTISCHFAAKLWRAGPGERGFEWVLLFVSIGAAGLMQLTSLGILCWLPIVILLRWCVLDWRSVVRPRRSDVVVLMMVAAVIAMMMPWHVIETWSERSIWASFGTATSLIQVWQLWPWTIGLVVPLGLAALGWSFSRRSELVIGTSFTITLAVLVVTVAVVFWVVSYRGVAPIWHRRFLIAGLPMLAWCFGAFINDAARRLVSRPQWQHALVAVVSTGLLGAMMWQQKTLPKLLAGRWQLTARGEDWRGAIAYLNEQAREDDFVAIDPGLIEQATWHDESDKHEYLSYPLRGPYEFKNVPLIRVLNSDLTLTEHTPVLVDRSWILSRRSASQLKLQQDRTSNDAWKTTVRSFGGVSVAFIEAVDR